MNKFKPATTSRLALLLVMAALAVGLAWPPAGAAQDKSPPDAAKLAEQLRDLQAKVAKLEAALQKSGPGMSSGMAGMGGQKQGMGGMMGMDGMMGGMGGQKQGMGGGGMEDDDMDMMGMMGKGSMGGMGAKGMKMKTASALPGFPGASHVYHIGAADFFLDHPEHITLTTEQQTKLNRAKQKALLDKTNAQRKIDASEQELWELTSADEPDAVQIEAKVQAIEKLRGEQRLAFIRSVGEAAKVLTDEQRKVLLGTVKPQAHQHPASPSK